MRSLYRVIIEKYKVLGIFPTRGPKWRQLLDGFRHRSATGENLLEICGWMGKNKTRDCTEYMTYLRIYSEYDYAVSQSWQTAE